MPTLTSSDLRGRLVVQPRGYQFHTADNLYDLNWVEVVTRLASPGMPGRVVRTRLSTWELLAIAEHCEELAVGQRAMWHPRFFDSGLHLWVRRSTHRVDACQIVVLLSPVTGPLPPDALERWEGDRLVRADGLEGLRFQCTRAALALFAEELRVSMATVPARTLQKTG